MSRKSPPFFALTENDNGGVAVVAALSMIVITLSIASIRYIVAARQKVNFQFDDATFFLSSFLAVASSVCIYRAVLAGLGKHIKNLDPQSLRTYYKLMYTAQLSAILSMLSAKLSVVLLLRRITQTAQKCVLAGIVMCIVWGIFAFFAIAFQCQLPRPWEYVPSECNTRGYLHFPVIISNMVTDAILGAAILPTIWRLNMPRDTKITVMILFGLRLLVSAGAIAQLAFFAQSRTNIDQPWASLSSSICLMMVTHLSVITATVPRTHSFWASLQSGKTGTAITEYELSNNSKNSPHESLANGSDFRPSKNSRSHSLHWFQSREDHLRSSTSNKRFRSSQEPPRKLEERSSQEPLRLTPNQQAELSTRIYSATPPDEALPGSIEFEDRSETSLRHTSLGDFGVWREREVRVEVEYKGKARKENRSFVES